MFSAHSYYQQDIQGINLSVLPWDRLRGKRILIAGATGLIGTFLVDTLFYLNKERNLQMTVYGVARDEKVARKRFKDIWENENFSFYSWDVTQPAQFPEQVDYVIHAACDTQPTKILAQPVETMMANILGTQHLLEVARDCGAERFLFLSSGSVYGQPWRPDDRVDEKYQGGLDCNTVRAAYAESKRAGETLCKAWRSQYGTDVVIARLAHVYGVTMRAHDTKPLAQMLRSGAEKKDIVIKGGGDQRISCCYVADAVAGLLCVLLGGKSGSAYNIAGNSGKAQSLKEIANYLAKVANRRVIFDLPEREEQIGSVFYTAAALDTRKLQGLGWHRKKELSAGIMRTVCMLQEGDGAEAEEPEDHSPWESDGAQKKDDNSLMGFFRKKR